ncbi:PIR protein, putative [Plasmodium sp. gorilla clade G1]|nr:PIR protein, putative [Plasmodium sp. gorilla clade G1]
MKLHYYKILLFSLPLNILEHNNKPYITLHTSTTTSRVVSECDLYMAKYDNDEDMKSVKENFDRQTSRRFEEYEEHMSEKRQKCKEQCDKDIQKIILKDKMNKSLAEKVEKGCLKCGCGLGGVAASIGLIGGVTVNELKKAALLSATQAAMVDGEAVGAAAGIKEGIKVLLNGLNTDFGLQAIGDKVLGLVFDGTNYNNVSNITTAISTKYHGSCMPLAHASGSFSVPSSDGTFCSLVLQKISGEGTYSRIAVSTNAVIKKYVDSIVSQAESTAKTFGKRAINETTTALTAQYADAVNATYASSQIAIIASVVAILVIVLVMIIIYLILRYRRKKKVNKKQQYTKLLNQ